MLERQYQAKLIRRLRVEFPGCVILKNDASYIQGIPDLTLLFKDKWAMLESKADGTSSMRPNQLYHIAQLNQMSFAAVIYPSNEDEIIYELQLAFGIKRRTSSRFTKSQ